jgi:hypothetical protein
MKSLQSSARILNQRYVKGLLVMFKTIIFVLLMAVLVSPALAYIGPGAGISVLGSLLSILATIVVAIGAIIFWPVRKYMKRRKARLNAQVSTQAVNTDDEVNSDDK